MTSPSFVCIVLSLLSSPSLSVLTDRSGKGNEAVPQVDREWREGRRGGSGFWDNGRSTGAQQTAQVAGRRGLQSGIVLLYVKSLAVLGW